jgi:hypothetical protein
MIYTGVLPHYSTNLSNLPGENTMREQPKHPTAIAALTAIIIVVILGGAVFALGFRNPVTSKTVAIRDSSKAAHVEGASITTIASTGSSVTTPPKQNKPKDDTPKPPVVLAAATTTPTITTAVTQLTPSTFPSKLGDETTPTTPPAEPGQPVTPPVVTPPVTDPCKSGGRIIVPAGGVSCSYTVSSAGGTSVQWSLPTLASTLDGLFTTTSPTAPVQIVIETASTAVAGQPFTATSITFHFKALATAPAGDYLDLTGLGFSYPGAGGLPVNVPALPLTVTTAPLPAPVPATV